MWQGMHVTAYLPLGTPDSASMTNCDKHVPVLVKDPLVLKIAEKRNKNPAQVRPRPFQPCLSLRIFLTP